MRRLLWWLGLIAGLGALRAAGGAGLSLPSPWQFHQLIAALSSKGAVLGSVSVLRVAFLAVGLYLVALGLLTEATRLPGVGRVAGRVLSLPLPAARLVWSCLGTQIAVAGLAVSITGASAAANPIAVPPSLAWLGAGAASSVPANAAIAPVLHALPAPLQAVSSSPPVAVSVEPTVPVTSDPLGVGSAGGEAAALPGVPPTSSSVSSCLCIGVASRVRDIC